MCRKLAYNHVKKWTVMKIFSHSYEIVADGEYHHVEILAVKKNFTLKVDGGLARSIINEGKNEYLGCYVDQIYERAKD